MSTKNSAEIVFESIRNVKLSTKLDKDGDPSSVIAFTTDADPGNLAQLIEMVRQRPITITVTSPQIGFGDLTPKEKEKEKEKEEEE